MYMKIITHVSVNVRKMLFNSVISIYLYILYTCKYFYMYIKLFHYLNFLSEMISMF